MKELEALKTKVGYIDESLTNLYSAVNRLIDSTGKKYNTVQDVPEYARAVVQRLADKGALQGGGAGLGLTEDMVRMLVILDRQGTLG